MSIPAIETADSMPSPTLPMRDILGSLNTEAKCVVLLAVPDGENYVPISTIRDTLDEAQAFELEKGRGRFNVQDIAKMMGKTLLQVCSNPGGHRRRSTWVKKRSEPLASFGTGLAGALLTLSADYPVSLRSILGERAQSVSQNDRKHSIDIRLAVLRSLVAEAAIGDEEFTTTQVTRSVEATHGIDIAVTAKHLERLTSVGLVDRPEKKLRRISLPTLASGHRSVDIIQSVLGIIDDFTNQTDGVVEKGIADGKRILEVRPILPVLIRKSYASSNHTGKSSVRNGSN